MFKRRYIVVALLIIIACIGLSSSDIVFLKNPESASVSFIGDTEVYEDDYVKIVAPKEITDSGYTYNNITIKQLPVGETKVDLAYGFNTKYIKPTSAEVFMPHWEYFDTHDTAYFFDVNIIENEPSEPCDYGNEYNTHKYKISHVVDNNTHISIVGFDSQINDGVNYTATWHVQNQKWVEWKDLTGHFESIPEAIHNNYDGKNKWYAARGLPVELGKEYQIRIYIEEFPTLEAHSHKYDIALKPHSEGLQESITKGHFYMLDPWYNTSQMSRFLFVFDASTNVAPYQIELTYHDLDLTAEMWARMNADAGKIYFTDIDNTKTYQWHNNYTMSRTHYSWWINITDSGTDRLWVYVDDGVGHRTDDGNKTFPFYDNFGGTSLDTAKWEGSTAAVSVSSGILTVSGINEFINTKEDFNPDKLLMMKHKAPIASWHDWGFRTGVKIFNGYMDATPRNWVQIYDTGSVEISTNWDAGNVYTIKEFLWLDSQDEAHWYEDGVEKTNSPSTNGAVIPNEACGVMIRADNNIDVCFDWMFVANTSNVRPILSTIGSGQYYATALYYNATTVYNNTRYGNYNIVAPMPYNSNRINHTFGTLGTQSNIKVNSWDNGTSPYLNFTVSGDTLDTMNVSNMTAGASYNLIANNGTTVQTVAAGDNGIVAFTSDMSAKTWTVEEAILSYPPPNPTNLQNTKGNFYVNYTWDKGAGGNITNSWNVSVNGTWVNETTEDWNNSVVGFHGTSTIIVFAYNSSGDGNRSKGYVTDSVTVDNNNPVLTNLSNIIEYENEVVYFYADATDIESDGVNFTCDRQDLFTFNSVTGTGSWDTSYTDNGTYNIDIGVHDVHGGTDNVTLKVNIYKNTTFTVNISTIKDTYVYEFVSGTNYDGLIYLHSGLAAGQAPRERYAYVEFDLSTVPTYSKITGAVLNIHQFSTDADTTVLDVYNITSSWDETTVTWDSKPTHVIGRDAGQIVTINGAKGWHNVNLLDTTRGWYNGTYDNYGISIWNTSSTSGFSPGFNASEGLYDKEATLAITYVKYTPPDPVTFTNITGNFYVNYSWQKGIGGNVTDSWCVLQNGTWTNGTTANWSNENVGAHGHSMVRVYAYNSTSGTISNGYVTDNITFANNVPVLSNLSNIIEYENNIVYIYADATDDDGDVINFTCDREDLFTFDGSTGTGSWDTSYGDNGTYNIDIGVHDSYGATDNQTVKINLYKNTTFTTNISTIKDTYVYEYTPNTNYDGYTYLHSGLAAGLPARERYIFIGFDLSTIPSNAVVIGAVLNIHQFTTDADTTKLNVYRATSSWDETTVDWNDKPAHVATNDSDTLITISGAKGWHQLGMLDTVRGWENSSYNNYGLSLWNTSITSPISPGFNASEGLHGKEAHLLIVYTVPTSRNVTDTITITDKIKFTKSAVTKPQDTITFTDKIAWNKTIAALVYSIDKADTLTITDKIALRKDAITKPQDTITITDKIALTKYSDFDVQDTITITDKIKIIKYKTTKPQDTITITDNIALFKSASTHPQDTITITDKIKFTKYAEFNIADTITITDKIALTKSAVTKPQDTITFTDKIKLTKSAGFDVQESITITDKIALTKYAGFDVQETITIIDKIALTKLVKIDKADTITITDNIKLTKYADFDVQETITITDKIKLSKYAGFDVQETITITDNISITKYAGFDVQDSITFTDKIALFKSAGTYPQDTITFTDKIKLSKSSATKIQDTITITDKIKLIKYVKIDKADTITFTDKIAHTKYASFDVADSITFTDNIATVKIVTIAMELLSMTPTELYQNSTGYLNLSYGVTHSTSGLNYTTIAFIYRNFDHDEGDSNHSIRPPNNSLAADWNLDGRILRGANRNETLNFENNDTITRGDTFSWSGLDYDNVRLTVVSHNSTYSYIYINATVHDVMPQMWYVDRTDMQQAAKTQMAINSNQDVLIKFWNYEIFKGNTDFLGVGYTDTALHANPVHWPTNGNPCEFYYLNDSYDPITGGDPLTSGYAVYMGSLNASGWIDHVYEPCCTASYVRGFIDNNLLELVTDTSEISYLYFRSNSPPGKSFYINVTDVATGSNVSFADTGALWAGSGAPYTAQPFTPNVWFAFMKPNITFDHQMYVADNDGNWVNTTINSTEILTSYFPPTKPTINHFHINGATDYDMNKCYNGTIKVGVGVSSDPDGGWVTHNLSLHYGANNTYVATINNTFTNENISHNGVFVCVNFTTNAYYSDVHNYTLRVIATDNEGKTDMSWLGVNFTLSITPRVYYYDPETPYASLVNKSQTFTAGFTQDGNVTWYLDGVNVSNFTNINYTTYTNDNATLGLHNLTVIIENSNGTTSHTWDWTVESLNYLVYPMFLFISIVSVCLTGYSVIYRDTQNFTHIIGGVIATILWYILGFCAHTGIAIDNVIKTRLYTGGLLSSSSSVVVQEVYQYGWLGMIFIVIGTIVALHTFIKAVEENKDLIMKKEKEDDRNDF